MKTKPQILDAIRRCPMQICWECPYYRDGNNCQWLLICDICELVEHDWTVRCEEGDDRK